MATESPADHRARTLADLQEAIHDRAALLADPAAYTKALTERAMQAHASGAISAEDLCEQLEWIDSAFSWAEEERLDAKFYSQAI